MTKNLVTRVDAAFNNKHITAYKEAAITVSNCDFNIDSCTIKNVISATAQPSVMLSNALPVSNWRNLILATTYITTEENDIITTKRTSAPAAQT